MEFRSRNHVWLLAKRGHSPLQVFRPQPVVRRDRAEPKTHGPLDPSQASQHRIETVSRPLRSPARSLHRRKGWVKVRDGSSGYAAAFRRTVRLLRVVTLPSEFPPHLRWQFENGRRRDVLSPRKAIGLRCHLSSFYPRCPLSAHISKRAHP